MQQYTYGELERLEELQEAGEALTFRQNRALRDAGYEVRETFAPVLEWLRCPARKRMRAAHAAMPPRHRRRYDDRTFNNTRGDAFFLMYERRMSAPTTGTHARQAHASAPRPRARRASSSSRTSGVDPGDDDSHHPERALGTLHDRTLVAAGVTR